MLKLTHNNNTKIAKILIVVENQKIILKEWPIAMICGKT